MKEFKFLVTFRMDDNVEIVANQLQSHLRYAYQEDVEVKKIENE